jgi:hypothetical protein
VLTATTVPGVETVLLTLAGQSVEAPLPSGELTSDPLTAADMTPFLDAAAATVAPGPPSATPALPAPPTVTLPRSPQTPPPR